MKLTTNRAHRFAFRTPNGVAQSRLETKETAGSAAALTGGNRILRTLVSLLSCAILGLAMAPAHAQDTPPKLDEKKQEKPAAPAAGQPGGPPAAQTAPAAPAAPAPGTVTVGGLVDGYYQLNFQHPTGSPTFAGPTTGGNSGGVNATRAFDYHNNFGLSLGEVNITRTPGKGFPLGFTGTFTVGDTPAVVYANEPGHRNGFEAIQQLYLTYTPHILGRDVAIDFGKFVTPIGYEVIESTSNDNYSRGLVFTYGVPFYHTGFRFAAPLGKKLNFTGALVNGWNNTTDDNDAKSFLLQFAWIPDSHFTGTFSYMGGAEGEGAYGGAVPKNGGGSISTNLYEFIPVYNVNSKLKLAGDLVYGDGAGSVSGTHVSGKWLGMAAFARYQWTSQIATAVRFEQFEDMPGVGALPGAAGAGLRLGSGYSKLREFTITLEYAALHSHLISRLEYRHDRANQAFGAIGPDQDTLTLGEAYKF